MSTIWGILFFLVANFGDKKRLQWKCYKRIIFRKVRQIRHILRKKESEVTIFGQHIPRGRQN